MRGLSPDIVLAERLSQLDEPSPPALLPIYSQMSADLQAKIFKATEDSQAKVVVAMNITETLLVNDLHRFCD